MQLSYAMTFKSRNRLKEDHSNLMQQQSLVLIIIASEYVFRKENLTFKKQCCHLLIRRTSLTLHDRP